MRGRLAEGRSLSFPPAASLTASHLHPALLQELARHRSSSACEKRLWRCVCNCHRSAPRSSPASLRTPTCRPAHTLKAPSKAPNQGFIDSRGVSANVPRSLRPRCAPRSCAATGVDWIRPDTSIGLRTNFLRVERFGRTALMQRPARVRVWFMEARLGALRHFNGPCRPAFP